MNGWQARAACRGQTDLFFPPGDPTHDHYQAAAALAREVCASCHVRAQCELVAGRERHGIWAGHDYGEARRQQQTAYRHALSARRAS